MSTQPTQVTAVVTAIPSKLSAFLKAHERLILGLAVAVLAFVAYTKGISYLASRDQLLAGKSAEALQTQVEANEKANEQTQQSVAQYQDLVNRLVSINRSIEDAQVQREQDTAKQQAADQTMSPPALADRWAFLLKVDPSTVQPTPSGYAVSPSTATQTVVQLEAIPELQANLQGEQTIVSNQSKQIDSQSTVVSGLQAQVAGLNKQAVDQTKACTDQITAVKAVARKSKIKWFFAGFVAGVATRLFFKF